MTPKELTALKFKFYDALICDPELSATALRVAWLLLSRYLNARSLVAWPSAETLAGDLGSSVRNVRRAIKQLTKQRWFETERGGGRRHSNVYSANFKRVTGLSPFPAQTAKEAKTVTELPVNGDRNGRETVTDLSPESPLREPIEKPFEGARARAGNPGQSVQGFHTDKQQIARQGDRVGGAGEHQGHLLLPINRGDQPPRHKASESDWNGCAKWLESDQRMEKGAGVLWIDNTLERMKDERGISYTEACAILYRELNRRRKAAA